MKRLVRVYFSVLIFSFLLPTAYSLVPTFSFAQSDWSEDRRLTYFPGYSYDPRAACFGDTIHLVWWESYISQEVFYKRSTDAGETWGADVLLSIEDTQSSVLPRVAVSDNIVHAIWFEDDYGLLYRRSLDGGSTWQDIDSIVPGMTYSSIYSTGDTVYIAGTIGSLGVLRFTKSYDKGNTWQPITEITKASSSPCIRAIANNDLSLVVSYDKSGSPVGVEVYHVLTSDGGDTWLDSVMLSHNDSISGQWPAMDTDDSGGVHISWFDYKYSPYAWTGDIFYRASRDSGQTWEEIDSLTVMHRAVASDILAEGTNLHLVWEDDRNDFNDNFEIYYRMSTDLGQTWEPEVRLTDTLNWSRRPSLACGGQYLHLFWFDLRDDTSNIVGEIYYKRKNLVGIDEAKKSRTNAAGLSVNCPTFLKKHYSIFYNLGNYTKGELLIIDVTGRTVKSFPVHQSSGEFVFPHNREVQQGIYFIMLRAGGSYTTRKVLVVH